MTETARQETVLDVTAEQIARTYAQGFIKAVPDAQEGELIAELEAIIDEIVDKHPSFGRAILAGVLSHDEEIDLVDKVLKGRVAAPVLSLLKVLSHHGRLGLLRAVTHQVRKIYNQRQGLHEVYVRSALPLPSAVVSHIEAVVAKQLSIKPLMFIEVDADIIAGLQIRIGDVVYDGSIRTIFEKARQAITDLTVERIEKTPERFMQINS